MKYGTDKCKGFPVVIDFYYENLTEIGEIGFIEIYRNGKFYSNIDFNNGRNIQQTRKMLRIANKERIKRIIKDKFRK
jgi:hypothetical protein